MAQTRPRSPESALPLKPADFQILMVLLQGDLHGYGIMQAVTDESRGKVQLEIGSMYRLIARLTDEGLIAESARRSKPDDRRRYYRITEFGREVAGLEARRLSEVLRIARSHELI
jgi:DNA-binding PadR family transcriptional regulator